MTSASTIHRHTSIRHSSPFHSKTRPSVTFASPHATWLEDSIGGDNSHHQNEYRNAKSKFDGSESDNDADETKVESGSDSDYFEWEEEATLYSELMDEPPRQTEDERVNALIESLQPEFTAEGDRFKRDIARAFVPTVNNIRSTFQTLEDQVDEPFARGTLQFDEATIIVERALHQEMTDLKDKYQSTVDTMSKLYEELEDEYALRDKLWVDLRKAITELVGPTEARLKDLPAKVERLISQLNRKSKAIERSDDPASDLKRYLAKLAS